MNNIMTNEQFIGWIRNNITAHLPSDYSDAQVDICPVIKTGSSYIALTVRKDGQLLTPAVNLNVQYASYEKGKELDAVIADIAKMVTMRTPDFDVSFLSNYGDVKEHLFIRVCSQDANKELLASVPHKTIADLAITYHITVGETDKDTASIMVTDSLMKAYKLTAEQLHADALANSVKMLPARIVPVTDMIKEIAGFVPGLPCGGMLVLTNSLGLNGASALFYPGILEEISRKMEGDYYVIPSSIHEIIAVPCLLGRDPGILENIVMDINQSTVQPEDRLSDRVYRYFADTRRLEFACGASA